MSGSLLLLDPYRSALACRGIAEKILVTPTGLDVSKTPTFQLGNDSDLQATVMQFVTLFDDVSIVQHEPNEHEDKVLALRWSPLRNMGVVDFTAEKGDEKRSNRWKTVSSLEELWSIERGNLDAREAFIIPMLLLKKIIPHKALYFFLRAVRLGDNDLIGKTEKEIPPEFSDWIMPVKYPDQQTMFNLDFLVFTALNEFMETEVLVEKKQCRVAHAAFNETFLYRGNDVSKGSKKLFEVVIEELLKERFLFPVPETLKEIQTLRARPDIAAFKSTFQPWIDLLAAGNLHEEKRLRKEVKAAIRSFEKAPRVRRINKLLTYLTLPVELLTLPGSVGLSTALAGIGLDKLAEQWQKKGKWVGLCRKSDKLLNIDYPEFK